MIGSWSARAGLREGEQRRDGDLTIIPDEGAIKKTIRFYDKGAELFYEIAVGAEGDLFILSGGLRSTS